MPAEPPDTPAKLPCLIQRSAAAKQDVEAQTADTERVQAIQFVIAASWMHDRDTAKIRPGPAKRIDKTLIVKAVDTGLHQNPAPDA